MGEMAVSAERSGDLHKAKFIKVDVSPGHEQTMPVEPARRLSKSDIRLEECMRQDAEIIAEGFYACFHQDWLDKIEPCSSSQPSLEKRKELMAKRLRPAISASHTIWMKAIHIPTSKVIGIAGWAKESSPVHNVWRRSAADHYDWKSSEGWTNAELEEIWKHVDVEVWEKQFGGADEIREAFLKGKEHWYLAPLITWPDWQGRGVGRYLLDEGLERAEKEGLPIYLESEDTARAVYLRMGFKAVGKVNMIWTPRN